VLGNFSRREAENNGRRLLLGGVKINAIEPRNTIMDA
jgi:hypothetical protein